MVKRNSLVLLLFDLSLYGCNSEVDNCKCFLRGDIAHHHIAEYVFSLQTEIPQISVGIVFMNWSHRVVSV